MEPIDQQILSLIDEGTLEEAYQLLWRNGNPPGWLFDFAPVMESAGDRYARSDKARAIWCYEQAQSLFRVILGSATSGAEAMALEAENPGAHLGKKIWLLR